MVPVAQDRIEPGQRGRVAVDRQSGAMKPGPQGVTSISVGPSAAAARGVEDGDGTDTGGPIRLPIGRV